MKVSASEIGVGQIVSFDEKLWRILKKDRVKPGKGGAFVQVEMKTIDGITKRNQRFRSDESVEKAFIETRNMQYLYQDASDYYFMDTENFEQLAINHEALQEVLNYLVAETQYQVGFYQDQPIAVQPPAQVVLTVVESESHIKGQTAASSGKIAKLDTGLKIQVPSFIETGDRIKVTTSNGKYTERA